MTSTDTSLLDDYRRLSDDVVRYWWADLTGFAAFAFGSGQYVTEEGKFHHHNWTERRYRLPDDLDRLAGEAQRAALAGCDVYVNPAVRAGNDRAMEGDCVSRYAWADVDSWNDDLQARWARLADRCRDAGGRPLLFDSGGSRDAGGRHAYLDLLAPVGRVELASMNRRLAEYLDADSKWQTNSLLRLPGTLNWKLPTFTPGTEPRRVA